MQDDPNLNQPNKTTSADSSQSANPASSSATISKKMLIIAGSIVGLLIIALIVLVIMLMGGNDNSNNNSGLVGDSSTDSSQDNASYSEREVVKRVPTSDDKLEYVIYKPVQNASNTTLYFAVENVCDGCDESTSAYQTVSYFDSDDDSYLIDDNNGKKYGTITDQDGEVLATPSCGAQLESGEKTECFVAFSKVPSGSTVSWVFGGTRIDNIKVE